MHKIQGYFPTNFQEKIQDFQGGMATLLFRHSAATTAMYINLKLRRS